MRLLIKLPLLIPIFFNISSVSASTIIDSFDDPQIQMIVADGLNTRSTTSAIGGFRTVEITDGGGNGSTAVVNNGSYSHNGASGVAATSKITWDADGAGLGDINILATDVLSFAGSLCFECFVLEIINIDQGNVDLTVEVSDGVGSSAYTSSSAGVGIHEILFSQFAGVDLTSIDSISLEVSGGIASDLELNFQGYTGTATVPLPASLWLFMTGFISFFAANRKRARLSLAA